LTAAKEFRDTVSSSVKEIISAANDAEYWKQAAIGQRHLNDMEIANKETNKHLNSSRPSEL